MNKLSILNLYQCVSLCLLLLICVTLDVSHKETGSVSLDSATLKTEIHDPISIAVYAECNKIRRIILAFRCVAGYFFVTYILIRLFVWSGKKNK